MSSVDIIIVNWNAGAQLDDCLASIARFSDDAIASVVVVDNASTDSSADALEARFSLPLKVVRNSENRGFARACNQGARLGFAPYVLFLNPDTRLFADSIAQPMAFMQQPKNSHVGICGIQLVDERSVVARNCARFPRASHFLAQSLGLDKLPGMRDWGLHMKGWDHGNTHRVDHVIGAFFFVRRSLFETLAGFDERFFVYLEDLDFSLRARVAAWETVYLADVQAFHASGGTSRQVKVMRLFFSLRSRLLYGFKHFPRYQAWLLAVMTLAVEPLTRVVLCLGRGDGRGVVNTLRAYRRLARALPAIVNSASCGR